MDDALLKKFEAVSGQSVDAGKLSANVAFIDDATGEVQVIHGDRKETHTLKPLNDLYGRGGSGSVDPSDEQYMPLFLGIEEEIARYDAEERLNDAAVTLALHRLSMNPQDPAGDALVRRIQMALRFLLSLNDYSRQEVRQAIRKIAKSVDRHNQGGRGRGYLDFIQEFFGPRGNRR